MTSRAITTPQFSAMMQNSSDSLSLVVRAHHSIEARIQEALEYVLPRADALELRRVAFLLKVDFLIALAVIHPKFRPLFEQVNTIRNRFAHDPYSAWEASDTDKVKSAIKAIDPKYPCDGYDGNALKVLMHVVFDYITRKYDESIVQAMRSDALLEMETDPAWHERVVPGHSELPPIPKEMHDDVSQQIDAEIEARVNAKLAARKVAP
jgi:hypothetical protein